MCLNPLRLILYFLFIITLQGCERDKIIKPQICYLSSIGENGRIAETFDYDTDGQLTNHTVYLRYGPTIHCKVYYNDLKQITKVTSTYDNNTLPEWEDIFEYSNNGEMVIRKRYRYGHSEIIANTVIEFNKQGQLIKDNFEVFNYKRYEYDQRGNLIKSYLSISSFEYLAASYENYDNKLSPLATSKSLQLYRQVFYRWPISKNNVLLIRKYDVHGSVQVTENYTNQYNSNNFLIEGSLTKDGQPYIQQFEYKCL